MFRVTARLIYLWFDTECSMSLIRHAKRKGEVLSKEKDTVLQGIDELTLYNESAVSVYKGYQLRGKLSLLLV